MRSKTEFRRLWGEFDEDKVIKLYSNTLLGDYLKNLNITYGKDKTIFRPRINKSGSQLDQQQRKKGEYYYV